MLRLIALFWLLVSVSIADVVKPALVEIFIYPDKQVEVIIDLSLEAVMSGIGTQYKNTNDAPNATGYDVLRALSPKALRQRFKTFESDFLNSLNFSVNGKPQKLSLQTAKIDIIGYKKRPRKTVLKYSTLINEPIKTLVWQFRTSAGDSAFRHQLYQPDEYNWSEWIWLRNGASSGIINVNQPNISTQFERVVEFIVIGFDHVIPLGWDHILFIVGMALSSLLWRRLLLLVSAFTLAHTLTLGLAMFGLVEIPSSIIEPLIAFSIAYVAIENLLNRQNIRRKSLLVFVFGLVHGLGFANMLKSFEMRSDNFLTTLIGFNIGVELAQVVLVLGVVLLLLLLKKWQFNYRKIAVIPISIFIALIGFWWGFERLIFNSPIMGF